MKSYTLVELVMVIVLIGILAAIGLPAILETADAWSIASGLQNFAVQSSIATANRISKEMRRLLDDASIITASDSQLTFIDINGESLTFNRSGDTLMRNSDGLADNITALTFTYFDDDNNTIVTPIISPNNTDIRRIKVVFSLVAGSQTLNFQFQSRPQNLRRLNEKFM